MRRLGLNMQVLVCDPLDDSAKCFNERSDALPDLKMRNRALDLAMKHGRELQP